MTHMDHVAAQYDQTIPAHVQAHYLAKRVAFVRRYVPRGTIVDVGCGTGLLGEALRATGVTVIGVDESLGMLRECHRHNRMACCGGRSAQLPITSASVDAAICVATLHHLYAPEAMRQSVHEMLRIVKPQGRVLIWDHNLLNPYWPLLMRRLPQDQEPTRLVPLRELRDVLAQGGAQDIRIWRLGLVPDFAPRPFLGCFQLIERVVEHVPGVRLLCAHNVVVARPGSSVSLPRTTAVVRGSPS